MGDLISRQAAIDALVGITIFKTKHELMQRVNASVQDEQGWLGAVAECLDEIEDLPSAKPETHEERTETHACDLISRQAAMNAFAEYVRRSNNSDFAPTPTWNDAVEIVDNLPSEEVQPVRQTAEWVYGEKDGADGWYCSRCGFHVPWYYEYYGLKNIDFIRDFHTCPHCDAKMLKYTGMERELDG